MELSGRLAVSYYKTISAINESHKVYLVQHRETNRIFVKKVLDVYDIRIYEKIYHNPVPGIPKIIAYYEENHQLILIEEYISGLSLADKIQQRSLTAEEAVKYTLDLCGILEYLHSLNPPVIHRDIKPSNVIISSYDRAVLLDFNAAKQFSATAKEDTVLLGTQGYAAPEQYGFGASSPLTDIYSLGVVLREMLDACESYPPELDAVVEKCTRLSPQERYASVLELREALATPAGEKRKRTDHKRVSALLPPGYRTRKLWKMIVASISYWFIYWMSFTLEVEKVYGAKLWLERSFCFAMMLSVVFISFDYLNVQRFFLPCRHRNPLVRRLGILLVDVVVVWGYFLVLNILESMFF